MQDQELRTWKDGLDRPGTVGQLIEFLQGIDADLPVVISCDGGWRSMPLAVVEDISVETDRGVQEIVFGFA